MSAVEQVRESQALLERMARYPEAVLRSLNRAEHEGLVEELRDLAGQAAAARTEADLRAVAGAVHRLAEKTPAPRTRRGLTFEEHRVTSPESEYFQEHAAQIRNQVFECQQELERALQNILERNEQVPPKSP